ncbi:hypothetical protein GCM10023259_080030 [Thermocatellispora tengchongensis]
MDQVEPTPEGALIRRIRLSRRITQEVAARKADITAEMWGHVERGHRSAGRGQGRVKVTASEATLARMAHAIGLQPADLVAVGRSDAAEILAEMLEVEPDRPILEVREREPEVMEVPVSAGIMLVAVDPRLPESARELVRRQAEQLAQSLIEEGLVKIDDEQS